MSIEGWLKETADVVERVLHDEHLHAQALSLIEGLVGDPKTLGALVQLLKHLVQVSDSVL